MMDPFEVLLKLLEAHAAVWIYNSTELSLDPNGTVLPLGSQNISRTVRYIKEPDQDSNMRMANMLITWNSSKGHQKRILLAAFRGTSSLADWVANLQASIDATAFDNLQLGVHKGWLKYIDIPHLIGKFREAIKQEWPLDAVLFTGHSLGGALAQIAAMLSYRTIQDRDDPDLMALVTNRLRCVTLAAPQPFTLQVHDLRTFVNPDPFVRQAVPWMLQKCINYVNHDDLVPRLPFNHDFFSSFKLFRSLPALDNLRATLDILVQFAPVVLWLNFRDLQQILTKLVEFMHRLPKFGTPLVKTRFITQKPGSRIENLSEAGNPEDGKQLLDRRAGSTADFEPGWTKLIYDSAAAAICFVSIVSMPDFSTLVKCLLYHWLRGHVATILEFADAVQDHSIENYIASLGEGKTNLTAFATYLTLMRAVLSAASEGAAAAERKHIAELPTSSAGMNRNLELLFYLVPSTKNMTHALPFARQSSAGDAVGKSRKEL